MPQLRIGLAQTNTTVGDLDGNAGRVLELARQAHADGAALLALPEMALTGYPVEDLALRTSFVVASEQAAAALAKRLADTGLGELVVIVGFLDHSAESANRVGLPKGSPRDAAAVIHRGAIVTTSAKHHLPNYGVFDEFRYFLPGTTLPVLTIAGVDVALAICEDLWQDGGPVAAVRAAGAGLLLTINASPYERDKDDTRLELCARRAREAGCALAYVNQVGGQDELVFDGDSMVVGPGGELLARAPQFEETLFTVDLDLPAATGHPNDTEIDGIRVDRHVLSAEPIPAYDARAPQISARLSDHAEIWAALVTGTRDYVRKTGQRKVYLGLSGGIDSTLTAAVACDAVGAENVIGISNPSRYSTDHSVTDTEDLAARTGLELRSVPIAPLVAAYLDAVPVGGLAEENLQARVRAVVWMAMSNDDNPSIVLACGNKSELATGYSTLYGDAVGGYAPIKDIPKTLVWELARWRNAEAERRGETAPIPVHAIEKPPSAELRPGQLDTDSLPPYDVLDVVLAQYVDHDRSSAEIVADGFDRGLVERVIRMVDRAEYKRRQYPPGPKVSGKAFGRDRRLPIASRWQERAQPDR
ncbi:MAG: NAD+ synthase [Mycobacteriales bacterium]